MPLVASSVGTDQLLGGAGTRPAAVDALAARTLVKGEPLAAPAGRADDFAWPRREVGREQAKGDTPVAAPHRAERWRQRRDRSSFCFRRRSKRSNHNKDSSRRRCRSDPPQNNGPTLRDFFGGGFGAGAASARAAGGRTAGRGPGRATPAG